MWWTTVSKCSSGVLALALVASACGQAGPVDEVQVDASSADVRTHAGNGGDTPDAGDDTAPELDVREDAASDVVPPEDTSADAPPDAQDTEDTEDETVEDVDVGRDALLDADVIEPPSDVAADAESDAPKDVEDADAEPAEIYAPTLVRVESGLEAHEVMTRDVTETNPGYGYGMTPFDADGDGDLDVFLGTIYRSDAQACVYENISVPGDIRFQAREEWCVGRFQSAVELHPTRTGVRTLVVQSTTETAFVEFVEDGPRVVATRANPEECTLGPLVPIDADWDGYPEVLISCIPDIHTRGGLERGPSAMLMWNGERIVETESPPFSFVENTIGLGALDINDDGLTDIVTVNDTFSSPTDYNPLMTPSSLHVRCGPNAGCGSERVGCSPGRFAYGSHMGFEHVWTSTADDVLIFSDRGEVFPKAYVEGYPDEFEIEFPEGVFFNSVGGFDSWAVLHSDWNNDGETDYFFSFGPVFLQVDSIAPNNTLLLSDAEAGRLRFDRAWQSVPRAEDDRDRQTNHPRSSRAATRLDLDFDGVEEIVVAAANRPPLVDQITPTAPRCTLRPTPRYAVDAAGYAVVDSAGRAFQGPAHGEVLSHEGRTILTHVRDGHLRFPTGALVPYSCDDSNVVDIAEPAWLNVTRDGEQLVFEAISASYGSPIYDLSYTSALTDITRASFSEGRWYASDALSESVMVRVNDRWVARWLTPGLMP